MYVDTRIGKYDWYNTETKIGGSYYISCSKKNIKNKKLVEKVYNYFLDQYQKNNLDKK